MNIHQNARLTPSGRGRLVRLVKSGLSPKAVAETMGMCPITLGMWVARFDAGGVGGLQDRSPRPHRLHRPIPAKTQDAILALRRQRLSGQQIACDLAVSPATVSRVLRRHGLNHIRDLEPPPPVQRYERAQTGELIHIDIKKLGRFAHRPSAKPTRKCTAAQTPKRLPGSSTSESRVPVAPSMAGTRLCFPNRSSMPIGGDIAIFVVKP